MNLNTYVKELQKLQKDGYGELPVIYANDEEGNEFRHVFYKPSNVHFDEDTGLVETGNVTSNAVCLN